MILMTVVASPSCFISLDDKAPCNIKLVANGSHEIAVKWDKPKAPASRINGYEVLCNGKVIIYNNLGASQYFFLLIGRTSHRSSRSHMFFKIDVVKNFAIFTGKHLCWTLFLVTLQT